MYTYDTFVQKLRHNRPRLVKCTRQDASLHRFARTEYFTTTNQRTLKISPMPTDKLQQ